MESCTNTVTLVQWIADTTNLSKTADVKLSKVCLNRVFARSRDSSNLVPSFHGWNVVRLPVGYAYAT